LVKNTQMCTSGNSAENCRLWFLIAKEKYIVLFIFCFELKHNVKKDRTQAFGWFVALQTTRILERRESPQNSNQLHSAQIFYSKYIENQSQSCNSMQYQSKSSNVESQKIAATLHFEEKYRK
jgi:hypothetical protein